VDQKKRAANLQWLEKKIAVGPQNLYGRDGKLYATFKCGMEKRWFSVPLLMTWCHQIDLPKSKVNTDLCIFGCTGRQNVPNCAEVHLYFQKFSGGDTPDSHNWVGCIPLSKPLPLVRVHHPTFSELLRPLLFYDVLKLWLYRGLSLGLAILLIVFGYNL